MILLLAGTQDARELGTYLSENGFNVLATAVSDYGGDLLMSSGVTEHLVGRLTRDDMASLIKKKGIKAVIDATHPYAQIVSEQTIELTAELNVPYLRYERESAVFSDSELIHHVKTVEEAAKKALSLGKRIFLTTGSKNLPEFLEHKTEESVFIARVLSTPEVLEKCFELGLTPKEIVAMQGPFSAELNKALYLQYKADVVVSKESGKIGGAEEKIKTALEMKLPLVLIDRPKVDYPEMTGEKEGVKVWLEKLMSK